MQSDSTCALYLRVSTLEQDLENQRPDLVRLARSRSLTITEIYEEKASARKERPAFEAMRLAAHQGKWDCLVVWSLDRLGRSMVKNLTTVLELDRIGVQVISCREPWLDTSGPVRSLLVAIFSWVADQEARRISERTKAGLLRAKRQGKVLGRPRKHIDIERALELRASGMSIRKVAQELRCGASTLHRVLKAHDTIESTTSGSARESLGVEHGA